MRFDFDKIIDRRGTYSMEYDWSSEQNIEWGSGPLPENYLPLDVADMDFCCAPCIQSELQKVVDHNLYGYCTLHPSMAPKYYDAIINWNRRRYGWQVKPEEIFYSAGSISAIKHVLNALTNQGDHILITPPVYTPFFATIRNAQRQVTVSHLIDQDGYYTIDWEDFEKKAAIPEVKAFLLCNPHNPVGRTWTEEELKRMYDICTRNNVLVISDEIHGDLIRKEGTFHPIAKVVGGKNVVVCAGANKTFNIAGLQASHIIVQEPDLRKAIQDELGLITPTPFVIHAVIAAYSEGEEWLEELREYIDDNIDAAIAFLHEKMPKVKVWRPEGTYLLWMNFSGYGLSDEELWERCYQKAGVGVEQGRDFDEGGSAGYIRIVAATQRSRLMEALERIAKQFE